jgi:AraC-like DNA-binding protein
MRYREFPPSPAARAFVQCYWTLQSGPAAGDRVQRVAPDGSPELIVHFEQPFARPHEGGWRTQPRCFFAGQLTGPLLLRPSRRARVAGVRFQPYGAARLFRVAMHELTERTVEIRDLAPSLARALESADDPRRVIEIVEAHMIGPPDPVCAAAVHRIRTAAGNCDVAVLTSGLGVSCRHLERRFREEVGIPPKFFARIQRFQAVFPAVEGGAAGWADAAVRCGYYDQAHLIRDFRQFAGEPPAAVLAAGDLARHFLQDSSHFSNTRAAAAG